MTEKNDSGSAAASPPDDTPPAGPAGLAVSPPRTAQRGRLIAVLVLLVALGAATAWWFTRPGDDVGPPAGSDRAAAVSVARQVATNFFSLDHETVDDDIAAVQSLATGTLAETYAARAEDLSADVRRRQLVVTAELPEDGTAVESLSADDASVLVSVDATSVAGKGQDAGDEQVTLYRVRVTLVPVDGVWRASGLEQVEAGAVADDGAYTAGEIADDADAAGIVQAGVDGLSAALSYDYRRLDAGLEKATASMTEDFADEFTETFSTSARRLAEEKQAVADAIVRGAGLVRNDSVLASVVVFVDQVLVSSETTKDPEAPLTVNQSRVLVDLVQQDGEWLIAGIQPF